MYRSFHLFRLGMVITAWAIRSKARMAMVPLSKGANHMHGQTSPGVLVIKGSPSYNHRMRSSVPETFRSFSTRYRCQLTNYAMCQRQGCWCPSDTGTVPNCSRKGPSTHGQPPIHDVSDLTVCEASLSELIDAQYLHWS